MDKLNPADKTVTIPVVIGIAAVGECILWGGCRTRQGYGSRWVGGRTVLAHRYAWTCVHGDPGTLFVLHRCDNPSCVNVEHMFLGTHADNSADKVAKGRQSRTHGERHGMAKLTDDQVREIRSSIETNVAIARRLGVSNVTVSMIRLRKIWVHVE